METLDVAQDILFLVIVRYELVTVVESSLSTPKRSWSSPCSAVSSLREGQQLRRSTGHISLRQLPSLPRRAWVLLRARSSGVWRWQRQLPLKHRALAFGLPADRSGRPSRLRPWAPGQRASHSKLDESGQWLPIRWSDEMRSICWRQTHEVAARLQQAVHHWATRLAGGTGNYNFHGWNAMYRRVCCDCCHGNCYVFRITISRATTRYSLQPLCWMTNMRATNKSLLIPRVTTCVGGLSDTAGAEGPSQGVAVLRLRHRGCATSWDDIQCRVRVDPFFTPLPAEVDVKKHRYFRWNHSSFSAIVDRIHKLFAFDLPSLQFLQSLNDTLETT